MNPNAKHTPSKATPGPWSAYNATGNAGRILKRWIVEAPTKKICTVDDQPADATAATAALIAAAPAMLEALQRLCASLAWEETRSGTTYSGYESAKAAIRSATGEE